MSKKLTDLRIINNVRVEIIRRKIDFTHLRLLCDNGYVTLLGELLFLDNFSDEEVKKKLVSLDKDLKRLAGVKFVKYYFDNWIKNDNGEWVKISSDKEEDLIFKKLSTIYNKVKDNLNNLEEIRKNDEIINFINFHISSKSSNVRLLAIKIAYILKNDVFANSIADILSSEKDIEIKEIMLITLSKIMHDKALPIINDFLKSNDKALISMGLECLKFLNSDSAINIAIFYINNKDFNIKSKALEVLAKFKGSQVIDTLKKLAASSNKRDRQIAINVLKELKFEYAYPIIKNMIFEADDDLRFEIILLFKNTDREELLSDFLKLLKKEKNEYIRATLVKIVGKIGKYKVFKDLLPYLEDSDARVRANTIEALWFCINNKNKSKLYDIIVNLINDDNMRVKINAITFIWHINKKEALNKLINLLYTKDKLIFNAIKYAFIKNIDKDTLKRLFKELIGSPRSIKELIINIINDISHKEPDLIKTQLIWFNKELREIDLFLQKITV